jgi:hypothetical protein
VIHHLKRATFIGEETGGGYYGNNSGLQTIVTLPNSKARLRLPMYEYWNAVPGYDGRRRGTLPDYLVETKASNLLRSVDEQLELVLKLAHQVMDEEKKYRIEICVRTLSISVRYRSGIVVKIIRNNCFDCDFHKRRRY